MPRGGILIFKSQLILGSNSNNFEVIYSVDLQISSLINNLNDPIISMEPFKIPR
jgi:hypothetical protein